MSIGFCVEEVDYLVSTPLRCLIVVTDMALIRCGNRQTQGSM